MRLIVLALHLVLTTTLADAQVVGFNTRGHSVTGTVTDLDGKPVAGADVHIVAAGGTEQIVRTDRTGRYRGKLDPRAPSLVFAFGSVRITGQAAIDSKGPDGEEAIEIHEAIAPAIVPQPLSDASVIPPYSDAAIEHNVWARAWLMVDVQPTGRVARVKLLGTPPDGLDAIAVAQALKLEFKPARDRSNQPIAAMVVWMFEWPSFSWVNRSGWRQHRLSSAILDIPCRGSGPSKRFMRDCSGPDMTRYASAPWITAADRK